MLRTGIASMLLVAATISSSRAEEYGFVALFNGKNLDGWSQRNGTATYRVEGDAIVGKTNEGSPNSFLCTDKLYGDFELKFEVKVDAALNSGVQIRSQSVGDTPDGRVNGPQVEISLDGMAGYVYGEAAGGWMTPDEDRKAHQYFKDGEWNAYHVVAYGDTIQVWLNGQQISDLTHEERFKSHPKGFIGLQVHGIGAGQGPYEVRWRNLKLRDLTEFKTLYNGKDLSGWKTTGNWLPQDDRSLLIQPRDGEKGWQRYDAYLWSDEEVQGLRVGRRVRLSAGRQQRRLLPRRLIVTTPSSKASRRRFSTHPRRKARLDRTTMAGLSEPSPRRRTCPSAR